MEKKYWEDKEYAYFSHKKCEYFPCHKGADPEDFNCLFCYCPLYALGDKCGGNFKYNEKGFKDCTNCQLPHKKKNYGYVTGKYQELGCDDAEVREADHKMKMSNQRISIKTLRNIYEVKLTYLYFSESFCVTQNSIGILQAGSFLSYA